MPEGHPNDDLRLRADAWQRAGEGMALVGVADRTIVAVNDAWLQMYGADERDLVGRRLDELRAPDAEARSETVEAEVSAAIERHGVWRGDVECARLDGSTFWSREVATPLHHPVHRALRVVMQSDITASRGEVGDLAASLDRERQRLAERGAADRRQNETLDLVSHEIRTPLTALLGFIDLLVRRADDMSGSRVKELLGRAAASAQEIDVLVNHFLDEARREGHDPVLEPGPLPLARELEAAVASLRHMLSGRDVSVEADDTLVVTADSKALNRVVINLLTNAAKYFEPDAPIRIRARVDGRFARVEIEDAGRGIAGADVDQVFERFGVGGWVSDEHGPGIGLNAARRLVRLQGGEAGLTADPGPGSTFWFTLPLVAVTPRPGGGLG